MCGIVGILRRGAGSNLSDCVTRMASTLNHRGPDVGDVWADTAGKICLGHRRLSILDLSSAGAQPMRSECGRLAITFNGEIYNHLEIRSDLDTAGAGVNWRGHSDTETILAAVRYWGLERALQRFNGMFAFGIWDEAEQSLTLCRDRFGEKPLFYGWIGSDLVFASELKALANHPEWNREIDRSALTAFMRYSYVPAPMTIWQGIRKLPPASWVKFGGSVSPATMPEPAAYWSFRQRVLAAHDARIGDEVEATDELQRLLSIAVKRQCLSDVPLGAFLSGGIDSSVIVALMQKQATRPVRTFTIGFAEGDFNEADDARRVANHLGTSHTELQIDAKTAMEVIPKLPRMYDEPFADSSQIPTHLVSVLARQHVTVALSGDAGDELFGGYNRHVWGDWLNTRFTRIPAPVRRILAALLKAASPEPVATLARLFEPFLPKRLRVRRAGDQAHKLAGIVGSQSLDDMYQLLSSIDNDPSRTILNGGETHSWAAAEMSKIIDPISPLDRMTLADALSYLTDDILQKVDRAGMSVSLETRVPFLDRDVVEFSARVPASMKVRNGRGKWLVRQLLYRHVPAVLVDRPKTGFSIPMDDWLRGPLRSWTNDLLEPGRLRQQGLFNDKRVAQVLSEHMSGQSNHGYWLWNVLMAQAWHDEWCLR